MKSEKVHQGKFTVILRKEEGGYSVRCVELPGAISEGKTRKEALENVREAIQGYLEAFPEEKLRLKVRNEVVQLGGGVMNPIHGESPHFWQAQRTVRASRTTSLMSKTPKETLSEYGSH